MIKMKNWLVLLLLIAAVVLAACAADARRPEPHRRRRLPPMKLLQHLYSIRPPVAAGQEGASSSESGVELRLSGEQFEELLGSVLAELESQLLASPQAQLTFSEVSRFGLPDFDNLKFRDFYVASYNNRLKHPNWVLEHMTRTRMRCHRAERDPLHTFVTDNTIHQYFCSNEYDYRHSGYDRGHLSPACDNMISNRALSQSYCFLNVAPQVRQLNRGRCPWARLESYVRHVGMRAKHTYVVTGTLYLPSHVLYGDKAGSLEDVVHHKVIGQSRVGVPSHFYKVVVYESTLDETFMEAYIMPNYPQIDEHAELSLFRVDIDTGLPRIEEASGLSFFGSLNRTRVSKPTSLQYGYEERVFEEDLLMVDMMGTPIYYGPAK